jgi:hypothetical protein
MRLLGRPTSNAGDAGVSQLAEAFNLDDDVIARF